MRTRSAAIYGTRQITLEWVDMQNFAVSMAPHFDISPELFKVSEPWLNDFFRRHDRTLRRLTTLFKLRLLNEHLHSSGLLTVPIILNEIYLI